MKKILATVGIIVATLAMSIGVYGADLSTLSAIDYDTLKISWSDEFEGTSLNTDYWTCQIGNGSLYGLWEWGNNEKQYYTKDNVTVSDGTMKITAKYEQKTYGSTTYYYTSGRITSSDKVEVGLGYVEAKIKCPSIGGVWPAFWMLGTNGETWPSCGEIDILETFGTRTVVQSTIHWPSASGADTYAYDQRSMSDKDEWHTYGCYRDGSYIAFYVDGTLLHRWTTEDLKDVLNDDYYILLNMACGGNLAGGTPSASDLPVEMEVDYVRYYVEKTAEDYAAEETTTATDTTAASDDVTVKKATIKSLKNKKGKKMKITLKKIKGVTGYQIRYCENKKFNGYIQKNTTKRTVIIKKLTKKQKYYVKARAYRKVNGKKVTGAWSKVKKVKIKK